MINRRDFIKSTAILTGGLLLPTGKLFANLFQEPGGTFRLLLSDVGYYYNKGGAIAWYMEKDNLVVVDAQFPETAAEFMAHVRKTYKGRISALINTHHHYDHTGGNSYLKQFSNKIIAHKSCVDLQKKLNTKQDPKMVTADTVYDTNLKLNIGRESLSIDYYGPAHTGGDSVVYFEKSNHLHMGDLVFNKVYPYFDAVDMGSLKNWISVLEKCMGIYPRDAFMIFGHAATEDLVVGDMGDVTAMRDYLARLLEFVAKEIKAGKKETKIIANTEIPGVKDRKELWPGALKSNLSAAYKELTKKKVKLL